MTRQWSVQNDCLDIRGMPFYWRLSDGKSPVPGIDSCLDIKVTRDEQLDYLRYLPDAHQWAVIEKAYKQDATIGFLHPESGQLNTYGSSVNRFFLSVIESCKPRHIYEIGCGAGVSIRFLKENGWDVTGVDPSEYSLRWSERLGFALINAFFDPEHIDTKADLVYCNDVFEHVPDVVEFSRRVCLMLDPGGVFCIATTNSTESIAIGDISMLEHQHVNMFTERSIYLILREAGFSDITINKGSYGNTFHILARKTVARKAASSNTQEIPAVLTKDYFDKAAAVIENFGKLYERISLRHAYVPLRCIPYLATVNDRGRCALYDSNTTWRGKFIDGYGNAIRSYDDVSPGPDSSFFVGSMTFHKEISSMLQKRGVRPDQIFWVGDIA
jgi:SAM-dependent methyltransferase